jgi:secondary thiamine-phosphate synthase enzyme
MVGDAIIMIIQDSIALASKGFNHIIDITAELKDLLQRSQLTDGHIIIFVPGATGGLTTIEYEPGLLKDFPEMLEKLAPMGAHYHHDATWHDGNGFSHLRASLIGPSLTVPFEKGRMILGTWQQVIFIDFDNRPRQRRLHVQIYGE